MYRNGENQQNGKKIYNRYRITDVHNAGRQGNNERNWNPKQKVQHRYQDVIKNEVNSGKRPLDIEHENNKQKM